jgi:hypothetical protein
MISFRTNGSTFETSFIDEILKGKIKVGHVISYKFGMTAPNGNPMQPKIYQIRHDLLWDDILAKQSREKKIEGKFLVVDVISFLTDCIKTTWVDIKNGKTLNKEGVFLMTSQDPIILILWILILGIPLLKG